MPSNADESETPKPGQRPWIGLGEDDSPATCAGLESDDEVLAVNGKRLKGDLKDRIEDASVGDELSLLVSRKNKIQEIELIVGGQDIPVRWKMQFWKNADVRQRVHRYNWLAAPAKEVVVVEPVFYKWTKIRVKENEQLLQ